MEHLLSVFVMLKCKNSSDAERFRATHMPKRPYGIINFQKHSIPIEERNLSLTPKGPLAPGTTGLLPCRTDGSLMHDYDGLKLS